MREGHNLVLSPNMNSHTCVRSVPKLVTLGDLKRRYDLRYALLHTTREISEPTASNSQKHGP